MSGQHTFSGQVADGQAKQHNGHVYNGSVSTTVHSKYTALSHANHSDNRGASLTNADHNYAHHVVDAEGRSCKRERLDADTGSPGDEVARKALLDSLYFEGYNHRKESLEGPKTGTFGWIYEACGCMPGPKENHYTAHEIHWPSFSQWLEDSSSDQQYCLMGKAGSGKPTLMA